MKSPKDMRIIQIDITNSCIHRCSNCTRFCGHYRKPFFMDFETFKRAVDSLDGFEGTVSMMGGEPTLHPEFERFARYLASKYPEQEHTDRQLLYPQPEFMKTIQELELSHTSTFDAGGGIRQNLKGPGLWSAMGPGYLRHYETIQEIFKYQALNDHSNPMYHQPALISRKDLNISDDEWEKLRDDCWVQTEWSATVTPKGAFFCEVAGALDMLFDGPGGWKIEKGWWKKTPDEFKDQLHWCELCGLALSTFSRDANEEIDDASPSNYELLKKINSPWMEHVKQVEISDGVISEKSKASEKKFGRAMPYTEKYQERFDSTKSVLYPKDIIDVSVAENEEISSYLINAIYRRSAAAQNDYIIMHSDAVKISSELIDRLKGSILNPGTLIYSGENKGFVMIFSPLALSIKSMGFDRISKVSSVNEFVSLWDQWKIIPFDDDIFYAPIETEFIKDKKYAIYGSGTNGELTFKRINEAGGICAVVVDSNEKMQGQMFHKMTVQNPEWLIENKDCYDYVCIGSSRYYREILARLTDMGFKKSELVCTY